MSDGLIDGSSQQKHLRSADQPTFQTHRDSVWVISLGGVEQRGRRRRRRPVCVAVVLGNWWRLASRPSRRSAAVINTSPAGLARR